MVGSVCYLQLGCNLVLNHLLGIQTVAGGNSCQGGVLVLLTRANVAISFWEESLEVYLEDRSAQSSELASLLQSQVSTVVHRSQELNILVLFLNNFIAWKHDEILFIDGCVKDGDESPHVVQEAGVELARHVLLSVKQVHLGVIDQLHESFIPIRLISIKVHSVLLIGGIRQIRAELSQMLFLSGTILLLEGIEVVIDGAHSIVNKDGILMLQVEAYTVRYFGQQLLKSTCRLPKLSHHGYLENLTILLHVL